MLSETKQKTNPPRSPAIQTTQADSGRGEEKFFLGKLFEAKSLCILPFGYHKLKWTDLTLLR